MHVVEHAGGIVYRARSSGGGTSHQATKVPRHGQPKKIVYQSSTKFKAFSFLMVAASKAYTKYDSEG